MSQLMNEYGRSFYCNTNNRIAENIDSSFVTDSPRPSAGGPMLRFYNMRYEDPQNPMSTLYFSYDENSFNEIKEAVSSGMGLTKKQMNAKACQYDIESTKEQLTENDEDLMNGKIDRNQHNMLDKIYKQSIDRFSECVKENK
jgi:hypothetical protein